MSWVSALRMLAIIFPFLLTFVNCANFPDPLPLEGDFFFVHDPSLVQRRSDGKYFLFTTHDKGGIITADNLAGPWTVVGSILPNNSSIQLAGRDDIWAPDVSLHGDTYYAYYAVSTFGSQVSAIGLATSTSMDPGTWTDHGQVFQSTTGDAYNAIDPNLAIDDNGQTVLTFGEFSMEASDIFQVNIANDFFTVDSNPRQVSFNSTPPQPEEGAFLWKHGDFYYLFFSSGTCCGFDASALPPPGDEYKVFVGRSISAHGPFLDANGIDLRSSGGTLVLASHGNIYAPGGQGIFVDRSTGSEREVFVYHYVPVDSPEPYSDTFASLGLNGLDWTSGWPVLTEL
ncbi:glycoside hydrolase family 43 protein [Gelatoporia subvermispora B]|uniref:Arabinan endo-1,5-alpha-L-arabinosidase n=1 Tax=Ceriporiopsis subvermispora (strain B) TaxID=914234 RepID=M2QRX4_CERS8|nr:glycoside hydrolase family 43 protein [Gelatoporia subvermispora B]